MGAGLECLIPKRDFRPLVPFAFQWLDECRVRKAGPYHERRDHQHEYVLSLAVIPLELELAQVAVQVLHADLVEAAYDPALEQAPVAVNRAGVNVAAHPLMRGVVHGLVVVVADTSWHRSVQPTLIRVD